MTNKQKTTLQKALSTVEHETRELESQIHILQARNKRQYDLLNKLEGEITTLSLSIVKKDETIEIIKMDNEELIKLNGEYISDLTNTTIERNNWKSRFQLSLWIWGLVTAGFAIALALT